MTKGAQRSSSSFAPPPLHFISISCTLRILRKKPTIHASGAVQEGALQYEGTEEEEEDEEKVSGQVSKREGRGGEGEKVGSNQRSLRRGGGRMSKEKKRRLSKSNTTAWRHRQHVGRGKKRTPIISKIPLRFEIMPCVGPTGLFQLQTRETCND